MTKSWKYYVKDSKTKLRAEHLTALGGLLSSQFIGSDKVLHSQILYLTQRVAPLSFHGSSPGQKLGTIRGELLIPTRTNKLSLPVNATLGNFMSVYLDDQIFQTCGQDG